MKKLFIISAVLLGVLLIFLGVYNFAFKKDAPANQQIVAETTQISSKTANVLTKNEKISAISDGAVIGAVFDKKTQGLKYYDLATGFVWSVGVDGQGKQQMTNTKVPGIKSVLWSPEQSKVLTMTVKDGQNNFYMYDYQSQKGTLLKSGLDTAVWDNLGTKIFYKYYDEASKKRTLNIANPDGSGWQKVVDIAVRNLNIAPVPLTSLVSYWNSPSASEETHLQVVGVTGGEPKTVLNGKFGADYLWSPDGSKALVSSLVNKDSKNITLGLVTIDGKYQDLNIPTLISKCIWSQDGKTLFYALAGGVPTDAIMPNDYYNNKFNTEDTFWKVDVATGQKARIIETADIKGKYDLASPFLSSEEDALYFTNKIDQKLYQIKL